MRQSNLTVRVLCCFLPEYIIPQKARCLLLADPLLPRIGRNIYGTDLTCNSSFSAKLLHKIRITETLLPTDSVFHMHDTKRKFHRYRKFCQHTAQADGIRSARHACDHRVSRLNHIPLSDVFCNLFYHYFSQMPATTIVMSSGTCPPV